MAAIRWIRRTLAVGTVVVLWATVASAVPANDNFADFKTVQGGVAPNLPPVGISGVPGVSIQGVDGNAYVDLVSTVGATIEAGEPLPCGLIGSTAWYRWDLSVGGLPATLHSRGSNFDTVIAVYQGNALGALALVGCNDDFGGALQSQVTFTPAAGTYMIQIGGFAALQGDFRLTVDSASM